MSLTKRDIIQAAFVEIGLGSRIYTATPEDLQDALLRLNALLAEWSTRGAAGSFVLGIGADEDDLDEDASIPANGVRGVICGLAVDIAPSYGRQVSADTRKAAELGKRALRNQSIEVPTKALDYTAIPAGAGHKRERIATLLPETRDVTNLDQSK